jgi:hypothetical protein
MYPLLVIAFGIFDKFAEGYGRGIIGLKKDSAISGKKEAAYKQKNCDEYVGFDLLHKYSLFRRITPELTGEQSATTLLVSKL